MRCLACVALLVFSGLSFGCVVLGYEVARANGIFIGTLQRVPEYGDAVFLEVEAWPILPYEYSNGAVIQRLADGKLHHVESSDAFAKQTKGALNPSAPIPVLVLIVDEETGKPISSDLPSGRRVTMAAELTHNFCPIAIRRSQHSGFPLPEVSESIANYLLLRVKTKMLSAENS